MNNKSPIEFINEYCDFANPHNVWILTGLSRSKDNGPDFHDYLERFILTKPEDILECYAKIWQATIQSGTVYRTYISLNASDSVKTVFRFQKTLLDISYGLANNRADSLVHAKKIASLWKSELAQKENRGTKRILVDIDTTNEADADKVWTFVQQKLKATIHAFRQTPNGFHLVMEATDYRALDEFCKWNKIPVDFQNNSMVFVERWQHP